MITIGFFSSKGGVGKTVDTLEMAAGLKKRGYRVLVLDMDCQGSLSNVIGVDTDDPELLTLKAVLDETNDIDDVALQSEAFGDLVPNNLRLFDADRRYTMLGALRKLKKALATVADKYDFALLDCSPSYGFLTMSSLIASDTIIVPQLASSLSGLALRQLMQVLVNVQEEENSNLSILGIIISRWQPRTKFSQQYLQSLNGIAESLNTTVYDSKIRQAVAIEESLNMQSSIFDYAPKSKVAQDYEAFVDETLDRLEALFGKEVRNHG